MGWNQSKLKGGRLCRRPNLESLETRQLLSTTTQPHAASSSFVNNDGSTNFDQVIQASQARSTFNVNGAGETVAVIDTGVNYNNSAFGGGTVGSSTNKVIAGVDFTGSPNGVLPTWEHGTGVAGLIASNNPSDMGVAPGANIVALRVFGDNNQGSFANIASALDWVVKNHAQYNITAVNMSISDGGNYTSDQFTTDGGVGQQITSDVKALDALNIPVISAAGNSYDGKTQGMGFPSIIPDAISVTATDESKMTTTTAKDVLASDAQRLGSAIGGAGATKIAAPGVNVTAPSGTSGTVTEDGTSFATPQVTGTVLLLQQMYKQAYGTLPTVAQLDTLLQQGSTPVSDPSTGLTVGRLDVLNSLQILSNQIQATQTTTTTTTATGSGASSTPISTTTPVVVANPVSGTSTTPVTKIQTQTQTLIQTPTQTTPPSTSPPTQAQPQPSPLINVIYNGQSVGTYSSTLLSTVYSRLFAFTKGPVTTLQGWGPATSALQLGTAKPTGTVVSAFGHGTKSKVVAHAAVVKHSSAVKPVNDLHMAVISRKR